MVHSKDDDFQFVDQKFFTPFTSFLPPNRLLIFGSNLKISQKNGILKKFNLVKGPAESAGPVDEMDEL